MKSLPIRILIHAAGILCFLAMPFIFSPDFGEDVNMFDVVHFRRDFLTYVLLIGVFYLNYYIIIPHYFRYGKYLIFSVLTVFCFAVVMFTPMVIKGHGPPPEREAQEVKHPDRDQRRDRRRGGPPPVFAWERNLFRFSIVLGGALLLRTSRRLRKAEQARAEAELSYLKAQINPHFLFNTLNSIYSLAITRSEHTPGAIQKLSDMMRYVTTEAHSDKVLLQKELNYVSNYIDLQKIRLGNTVAMNYTVNGEPGMRKIAPLILIPFVENAFKYGVNPEKESEIEIRIDIGDGKLKMAVRNRIVQVDFTDEYRSGHGMSNVEQRLKMSYPGKHMFAAVKTGDEYNVNLEVEL